MRVPGFPPKELPSPRDRIDGQQHFIRKPMFEQRRGRWSYPKRTRFGPSWSLRRRMPSTMSVQRPRMGPSRLSGRWVTMNFVAALRPSAIGLLGAFGQKPQPVGLRRQAAESKSSPYAAIHCVRPAGIRGGPVGVQIAVIGRVLDHAVQRDVLDDLEPSHLRLALAISR